MTLTGWLIASGWLTVGSATGGPGASGRTTRALPAAAGPDAARLRVPAFVSGIAAIWP